MLTNEKYIGQVLMQKTYTPDFLTGRQEKNRGQLEMVLVENAHKPIIEMKGCIKRQKISGTTKQEQGDVLTMKLSFGSCKDGVQIDGNSCYRKKYITGDNV